jgi:hypothetical protein
MALAAVCLSCGGGGSNDGGSTSGGDVATLTVSKSDYTISATDTKVTLNVTSTDKYYVRSKGTWVVPSTTQESTASTFDLSVAENGYMDRIDTVTVTSGKLTQTVYITQTMKSVPAIADDQTGMTSNALTLGTSDKYRMEPRQYPRVEQQLFLRKRDDVGQSENDARHDYCSEECGFQCCSHSPYVGVRISRMLPIGLSMPIGSHG